METELKNNLEKRVYNGEAYLNIFIEIFIVHTYVTYILQYALSALKCNY